VDFGKEMLPASVQIQLTLFKKLWPGAMIGLADFTEQIANYLFY
jgi:hypothetical protein